MKKFLYIPFIVSLLLICSAKDIDDSFDNYSIGLVVADSTSLNSSYEKPIWRNLRIAGHTVVLIDTSRLTEATYNGSSNFSVLDLVIIPNFLVCPKIDTSVTGGIGEVPVLCLEDSLWEDLGFYKNDATEPIIYIADYTNKRIIQTKWDTVGWKSVSLGLRAPWGFSLNVEGSVIDTTYFFYGSYLAPAPDTLFKRNWSGTVSSTYGVAGSGTGQFNYPRQIHTYDDDSNSFNLLVADGNNTRIVDTKFGDSGSWREIKFAAGSPYATYKTTNYWFAVFQGATVAGRKFYRGTSTESYPEDSTSVLSTSATFHMFANDDYVFIADPSYNKIIKFSTPLFTRLDSLTNAGKVNAPLSLWYDEITEFIYWVDSDEQLKRAKFDGTSDGADIDSCFSTGSGVGQIGNDAYGGIQGFFPRIDIADTTIADLKIETFSDSITVIFADTLLAVFSDSTLRCYGSNGKISGLPSSLFTDANNLCSFDNGNYSAVFIDTINSQKRIGFGAYDVSKLYHLPSCGWTLFNRCIGRLVEADQDSTFKIGQIIHTIGYWPYEWDDNQINSADTSYKFFLETNMHKVSWISDYYGDSSQVRNLPRGVNYPNDLYDFKENKLYIFTRSWVYPESLLKHAKDDYFSILDVGVNFITGYFNTFEGDSIRKITVANNHAILTNASFSIGDTINIYNDKTYPFLCGTDAGDSPFLSKTTNPAGWTSLLKVDRRGTEENSFFVSTTDFLVSICLGGMYIYNFDFFDLGTDYWTLNKYTLSWLIERDTFFPPSSVTVTAISDSSFKIEWIDSYDDEEGFAIYLKDGGQYSGEDVLLSITSPNVTSDTVSGFWPPSSQWFFDVGGWRSGSDTVQSGVPINSFLFPRVPQKPIVYALSDTSINIIINGYNHYDLFTDTTLSTNPAWVRTGGGWSVEKSYNRLKTTSTSNIISTKYDSSSRDIEIRTMFHFNDSLRLNSQSVEFHFVSSNNTGTGDGYYIYADSITLQVRKQTGGSDVDTLYDGTYTGNYKWRTLRLTNDWTKYPGYKSIHWGFFLDGTLQGVFDDTTYQKVNYVVLKGSHRRQWWDSFWIKHYPYPAGNDSTTTYAVYDSVANKYLTSTGVWGTSAVWQTYSAWDSTAGTMGVVSPYTAKRIRVKARSN
jgi:hypothetical protein